MSTSTEITPLTEKRVMSIRNDILDSIIKDPAADSAEMTRKIAKRRKVTVQQVAGVRAALSRGRYGAFKTLLKARKAEKS